MRSPRARPVFLNLLRIRQSVTAIASILHRLSGLLLVVSIPILIYFFDVSLRDARGFAMVEAAFDSIAGRLLLVIMCWSLTHHMLAGIRFLLIDLDVGVEIATARRSAAAVIALGLILALAVIGFAL